MFLHTSSFMQRFFYTQVLFTQTYFDTQWQVLLHKYFCTVMFFHRGVFFSRARTHTHRMLFHVNVFKHTCFYTKIFVQRGSLTRRCHYKQRFSYKGMHLHKELFHTDVLTKTYFGTISDVGHEFCAREFSKQMQHGNFTTAFDNWDAFRAKGLREQFHLFLTAFSARASAQNHPNAKSITFTLALTIYMVWEALQNHWNARIVISLQFLRIDARFVGKRWPSTSPHCDFTSIFDHRHIVREGCASWTSIHAALPPLRTWSPPASWICRCF